MGKDLTKEASMELYISTLNQIIGPEWEQTVALNNTSKDTSVQSKIIQNRSNDPTSGPVFSKMLIEDERQCVKFFNNQMKHCLINNNNDCDDDTAQGLIIL